MIYNDKTIEIEKVEAPYAPYIIRKHSSDTYIKIVSKDGIHITFTFKDNNCNPKELEINKNIDLKQYIYWDVTLVTNETYYLFDLTKDVINLRRIDDNNYNLYVHIDNPDMIYSPLYEGASFKNLYIDCNFSFIYEEGELK